MTVVVDASVAVKWFVPEEHTDHSLSILAANRDVIAPDLLRLEVANTLLKKHRRGELDQVECIEALSLVDEIVEFHDVADSAHAFGLAVEHQLSAYDGAYVAVALETDGVLITADRKILDAIAPNYSDNICWIEDVEQLLAERES